MYVVTVNFTLRKRHAREFLDAVRRQARDSLAGEASCRVFDVCTDPNDECKVLLYEKYDSKQAFEEHLETPHFRTFDRRVAGWTVDKQVHAWLEAAP